MATRPPGVTPPPRPPLDPGAPGPGARAGKVLRVGVLAPVSGLDAPEQQEYVASMVLWQIFERPYQLVDPGRPPEPVLFDGPLVPERGGPAAGFSAGLRPGTVFSDGTLMTAGHVAAALSRSESFTERASVSVRADRLVFSLKTPNPRFDLVLTEGFCGIARESGGRLIGSGPFHIAADATADRMRLVRNPRYRHPVPLDEVVFACYPPTSAHKPERLLRALDDGEVDFCNVLSRDDVSRLKSVRKLFQPGASTALLYVNTERPALRSPEVRAALGCAIHRDDIARASYANALAFAASSLLPPALDSVREGFRYNLERARDELARLAVRFPARLRLLQMWAPRPYLPHPRVAADLLEAQLRAVGVTLEVVPTRDAADYYDRVTGGDYDFALGGWIAHTADPADFLEALLHSERVPEPGKLNAMRANYGRLRSPQMDAALKRHREEPSPASRAGVLDLVAELVPLVPLMYGPTLFVHSRRVRNFTPPAIGVPSFADLDLDE